MDFVTLAFNKLVAEKHAAPIETKEVEVSEPVKEAVAKKAPAKRVTKKK